MSRDEELSGQIAPLDPSMCLKIGIEPQEHSWKTTAFNLFMVMSCASLQGLGCQPLQLWETHSSLLNHSFGWIGSASHAVFQCCYKYSLLPELRWERLQQWVKYRFFFFFNFFISSLLLMPMIQRYSGAVESKAVWEARVLLKDARNLSNQIFVYLPSRKMVVSLPLSKNSAEECCTEVF